MNTLEELRREHTEMGIGPGLMQLLDRIVRATAVTYPPSEYSDAGVWNREALEDALHDWIEKRLIGRGDLSVMLGSASTMGSLRSALTRSLSQLLTNRRRRTSASNLYKRTLALLRRDDVFRPVGPGGRPSEQLWALTEDSVSDPSTLSLEELVKAAWELSDEVLDVVRYGPYSLKSSPILREPRLRDFIVHVLRRARGCLTTATMFEVMRHRFNLVAFARAELEEELESDEPSVLSRVERADAVRSILARLGGDNQRVLREFARSGGDVEAAAGSSDESVESVSAVINEVMAAIADYAESAEEAVEVYRALTESLF
ncbi:MAG: hypothetical protein ACREA0_02910 [bacterium]